MHIHLGLAGLTTLVMLGVGGYLLMQGQTIANAIGDLSDKNIEALLESLTFLNLGSWYDNWRGGCSMHYSAIGINAMVVIC